MAKRRQTPLVKFVFGFAFVALAILSVWVFQNRDTLAAACLNTINGVSSKLAHLNEPFGIGTNVESRNPIMGIVPEFSLTERSGQTVKKSDLIGDYWVASFIFTRCVSSCPVTVGELVKLQDDLPEAVRLVSFSVDPTHDTPEVLSEYANEVGADLDRWLFLTGDRLEMVRYIREGFYLAIEANDDPIPGWEVTHSPRFALVDAKGRIRGFYESSNPEDLTRLRSDVQRLFGREPKHS